MADLNLLNLILNEVLICACEVLESGICDGEPSRCLCPCRAFVTAGPPVMDFVSCCPDGQLAVWVDGDIYPFSNFPSRNGEANICSPSLAANIKVQLLRCWPGIKEDGSAPTGPEIQAASEDIYRDLYLLTWGLVCCLKVAARRRKFVLNGGRIVGPTGGCVGVEISFIIELLEV